MPRYFVQPSGSDDGAFLVVKEDPEGVFNIVFSGTQSEAEQKLNALQGTAPSPATTNTPAAPARGGVATGVSVILMNGKYYVSRNGSLVQGPLANEDDAWRWAQTNYPGTTNGGTLPSGIGTGPSSPYSIDPNKIFQTRNGPKKGSEIAAELRAAGYNGSGTEADMLNAYEAAGRPTGSTSGRGGSTGSTTGSGGGSTGSTTGTGGDEFWNDAAQRTTIEAGRLALEWSVFEEIDKKKLELESARNDMERQRIYQEAIANGIRAAEVASNAALRGLELLAQLRGPRNVWVQQAVMHGLNAAGLTNLVGQLTGQLAMPAFHGALGALEPVTPQSMYADLLAAGGQPTGQSPWGFLQDVMQNPQNPTGTAPQGTAPTVGLSEDAYLDWIWANAGANWQETYMNQGWKGETMAEKRAIVRNWIQSADPRWKGKTPRQVAEALGYKAPQAQGNVPTQGTPQAPHPINQPTPTAQTQGTQTQNALGVQSPTAVVAQPPPVQTVTPVASTGQNVMGVQSVVAQPPPPSLKSLLSGQVSQPTAQSLPVPIPSFAGSMPLLPRRDAPFFLGDPMPNVPYAGPAQSLPVPTQVSSSGGGLRNPLPVGRGTVGTVPTQWGPTPGPHGQAAPYTGPPLPSPFNPSATAQPVPQPVKPITNPRRLRESYRLNFPAPNKVSPSAWAKSSEDDKDFSLATWEMQGWSPSDALHLINRAAPQFKLPRAFGWVT